MYELNHWIAFLTWESEQSLPEKDRPIHVFNADQAATALDKFLG